MPIGTGIWSRESGGCLGFDFVEGYSLIEGGILKIYTLSEFKLPANAPPGEYKHQDEACYMVKPHPGVFHVTNSTL